MSVRGILCFGLVCLAVALSAVASPMPELDYQGKILISDLPFTGPGYFKLALSDTTSSTNFWSNDGSVSLEPASSITGSVYNGVFSFVLGDSTMNAIPTSLFYNGYVLHLRVWFSTDDITFNEMLPSQKLVSSPYAINSDLLDGYEASELISIATNNITLSGDVTGPSDYNTVDALQGNPLNVDSPASGQVLSFDGSVWTNAAVSYTETDPIWTAASNLYYLQTEADALFATNTPLYVEVDPIWAAEKSDYATGTPVYVESDPIFTAVSNSIVYQGDVQLNDFSPINTCTAAAPNSKLLLLGAGNLTVTDFAPTSILFTAKLKSLDNVVWVATNGTPFGPGDIDTPFNDLNMGYATAALKGSPATLVIASGVYTNTLTMMAGNVHILGFGRPEIDSLMVMSPSIGISGKQRVENIIVKGTTMVGADGGSDVKFHNSRFTGGMSLYGPRVEIQDCFIAIGDGPALTIGTGATPLNGFSIYNTSIESETPVAGALEVADNIGNFEMIGCEVVNRIGPAVWDHQSTPITPLHLYTHNYIKGVDPVGPGGIAFESDVVAPSITIALHENTIYGNVGSTLGAPMQIYANNSVYGTISWMQAINGGADMFNNTYISNNVTLPDSWND